MRKTHVLTTTFFLFGFSHVSSHPAEVAAVMRKADRYVREATDDQAQKALDRAYAITCRLDPSNALLPILQDRLERYNQEGSQKRLEQVCATQEDLTYLDIEKTWREGKFWQAKKRLNTLLQTLCRDAREARSHLAVQCVYLQAEMECMQGDFLSAYRAYTQARQFAESAYAPWNRLALLKAIYCLVPCMQGCGSLSSRILEAQRLIAQLPLKERTGLLELIEPLHKPPISRQTLQKWREEWENACACVPSLEAYHAQSVWWKAVKEVMRKEGGYSALADEAVLRWMHAFPDGLYLADSLHHLACSALKKGEMQKGAEWRRLLEESCPHAPQCAECCFYFARDREERGDVDAASLFDREVVARFPESAFAAESAFLSYPYQDYMEGKQEVVEHLLNLEKRFPHTYYALLSRYVRALSLLYPSYGGGADPHAALNLLSELIELSIVIMRSGDVLEEDLEEMHLLSLRALYEQAGAYRLVANESKGAKKKLFLAYSKAAYEQLNERLGSKVYGTLKEECEMALAECAADCGDEEQMRVRMQSVLDKLDKKNALHQRLSARVYFILATNCARLGEDRQALKWLKEEETFLRGLLLTADERFEILFLQSKLHRRCGELEEALLALSDIVNDPSVSPKRFQALYERAEIFCEQGRIDYAKRQWQALLTADHVWAEKASKRLEEYL